MTPTCLWRRPVDDDGDDGEVLFRPLCIIMGGIGESFFVPRSSPAFFLFFPYFSPLLFSSYQEGITSGMNLSIIDSK